MLKALDESFSSRTAIPTRNLHKLDHAHAETIFIFETQCKLSQRTRYLIIDATRKLGRPCRGSRHGQKCSRWRPERHTAATEAGQVLPLSTSVNAEPPAGSYTAASGDLAVYGMLSPMSGGDRGHSEQIKGTHTCAAARARTATCSSATSKVKQLLAAQPECRVPGRHSSRAKM